MRYEISGDERMIKSVVMCAVLMTAAMFTAQGQPSPPAQTSVTIGGKTLSIKYSAPSVKGRKMFGDGGRISNDPTYPVWRPGANSATAFQTDADLAIHGLLVPAGDHPIFVRLAPEPSPLILTPQTTPP